MEEKTSELIFKAEGITCSGCATGREKILQKKEGTSSASVNLPERLFTSGTIRRFRTEKRFSLL